MVSLESPKGSIKRLSAQFVNHNPLHHHHPEQHQDTNHHQNENKSLNLAQQYESDKQKLVKYCFSKYEADGTLHESYITHVRIIEDSHYPSSRPPPSSNPNNKKTRILSLAVKRSGTVRLHKGRENSNGSFQIGRTWNLDELTEVQIDRETESGMLVMLGKPYYWATNTQKERTVFLKSVCNIYHKFTRGGLPVLVNFDKAVFGDIISLGSHGRPPTLRYTTESQPTPPPNQQRISQQTNNTRISVANSSYENPHNNNKNSMISNSSSILSPASPLGANGMPSPIGLRENSYMAISGNGTKSPPMYGQKNSSPTSNTPTLTPRKSVGSIQQKTKMLENSQLQTPNKSMGDLSKKPSLGKLSSVQKPQFSNSPVPPLAFKSPSMNKIESPSPESRAAIKNDILTDNDPTSIDRGFLKDQFNSVDNNGIDGKMDTSKQQLSPGKMFDSPTMNDGNTLSTVKSNRSSILNVEFKNASPRNSSHKPSVDENDDSAAVMNEIYKQRLNKKPSMRLRKSNSKLNVNPAPEIAPDIPPPPSIIRSTTMDSGVDISSDNDDQMEVDEGVSRKVSINHIYDDSFIEEKKSVTDAAKRVSINGKKDESTALEELFEEIDWNSRDDSKKIIQKLNRTLLKTEFDAVNSLINISSNFGEIDKYIEASIQQCEKLDPMLTFFQIELDGFGDEISFIENQASGLQVTTANKKILWNNLKDIISNVSLSTEELKILNYYQISRNEKQIMDAEEVLVALYSALKTIRGDNNLVNSMSDLANMRALDERNKIYEQYSQDFLKRVQNALVGEFKSLYEQIDNAVRQAINNKGGTLDVDLLINSLNKDFSYLLVYGGFILFAKEISKERYFAIMDVYQRYLKRSFSELVMNFMKFNNHILYKLLGEEFNYSFSFDYRNNRSNLIIDQSQKLTRKNVRNLFELDLCEVIFDKIDGVIKLLQNLIIQQQNFIGDFFHLSDINGMSLKEYVDNYRRPGDRVSNYLKKDHNTGLISKQNTEETEKAEELIGNIFIEEINNILKYLNDFVTKHVQIVPALILVVDNSMEVLSEQNNDLIVSGFLKKVSGRFKQVWSNFNQIQGKIFANNLTSNLLIDKQIGILFVIKSYVQIVKFIEKSLKLTRLSPEDNSIRVILDFTYESYNQSIMKSFTTTFNNIQNNSNNNRLTRGSVVAPPKLKKSQEEEIYVNKAVNLITNGHYLIESFQKYDLDSITHLRNELSIKIYKDCISYYINVLIQTAFNKLIEFVEGIESLVKTTSRSVQDPTKNNTYSKENFHQLVSFYNKQEVHDKVETSYKKVESDFSYNNNSSDDEELLLLNIKESDMESVSAKLVTQIWQQVETEYILIYKRLEGVTSKYYRDVDMEVNRSTLVQIFNNIKNTNGFR